MTKAPEVLLPAGARTVQVSEIPGLLAQAIHPESDAPVTLHQIIKANIGPNGERNGRSYPLTDDDMALLVEILGPAPEPGEVTSDEKWMAYIGPWFTSPRRPAWTPGRQCIDPSIDAALLRADAEESHKAALIAAIRDGSFVPLNHALVPLEGWTGELLGLGQVFVQQLSEYAAKFGISVRTEPNPTTTPPNSTSSTHEVPKPSVMTKPPPKLNRPDWGFWRHMPEVRLWQAVMLSFNTEPDPDYLDGGHDYFLEENPEASKRLQLLRANLSNRQHFSAGVLNLSDGNLHGVQLAEFAAWAADVVQWSSLPPELVAIAQRPVAKKREASAEPPANATRRIQSSGHEQTELHETVGESIAPEQTAAVSEIVEEITEKTLLSSLDQWESHERTPNIEKVARAYIERNVLDNLRELINTGRVIARDPVNALPLHGPLDYGFACDLHWNISPHDGVTLAHHVAAHPVPSFKDLVAKGAQESEENARIRAAHIGEKEAAGRYTLEEAAKLIATNTGERDSAVLTQLVSAVKEGKLTVYEPGRNLPYRPATASKFYEEAYWNDLNALLDGIKFRNPWRIPPPSAEAPSAASGGRPQQQSQYHDQEILRVAFELEWNPLVLPRFKPGIKGARGIIRDKLPHLTDAQFKHAWERLSKTPKRIKYAE